MTFLWGLAPFSEQQKQHKKVIEFSLTQLVLTFDSTLDNVLIIQNGKKYRSLVVKKNRFDGALGAVPYRFEKDSKRICELTDEEIIQIEKGNLEIKY